METAVRLTRINLHVPDLNTGKRVQLVVTLDQASESYYASLLASNKAIQQRTVAIGPIGQSGWVPDHNRYGSLALKPIVTRQV